MRAAVVFTAASMGFTARLSWGTHLSILQDRATETPSKGCPQVRAPRLTDVDYGGQARPAWAVPCQANVMQRNIRVDEYVNSWPIATVPPCASVAAPHPDPLPVKDGERELQCLVDVHSGF